MENKKNLSLYVSAFFWTQNSVVFLKRKIDILDLPRKLSRLLPNVWKHLTGKPDGDCIVDVLKPHSKLLLLGKLGAFLY